MSSKSSDDTKQPGFVSTIVMKFSQLSTATKNANSSFKRDNSSVKLDRPKPLIFDVESLVDSRENISDIDKEKDFIEETKNKLNMDAKFEVVGEVSVKDRIKAYLALTSAFNKAAKSPGLYHTTVDLNQARAKRKLSMTQGDSKSSITPMNSASISKKNSISDKSEIFSAKTTAYNQSSLISDKSDSTHIKKNLSKQNSYDVSASVNYMSNNKIDSRQPPIYKKKDDVNRDTSEPSSPIVIGNVKNLLSRFSKDSVSTSPPISRVNKSNITSQRSSGYQSPEYPSIVESPKIVDIVNNSMEELKFSEKNKEKTISEDSLKKMANDTKFEHKQESVPSSKSKLEHTSVSTKDSDTISDISDSTDNDSNTKHAVYSFTDSALIKGDAAKTETMDELNSDIHSSSQIDHDESTTDNMNQVGVKDTDSIEYIEYSSNSDVSSVSDLLDEFDNVAKEYIVTDFEDAYYPLPKSYIVNSTPESFSIILPPPPKTGCIKTTKSSSSNRKRINIVEKPDYFETYSIYEYERGDEELDPLTASAEYEIEKKTELLDKFEVQLNKDEKGLGLSIVGIGLGSDMGAEKLGIYIKALTPGGAAERSKKLNVHDQLLEVDGISLVGVTQVFAAQNS